MQKGIWRKWLSWLSAWNAVAPHGDGAINVAGEWSGDKTVSLGKDVLFKWALLSVMFPFWMFQLRSPMTTFPGNRAQTLSANKLRFYRWPYLRCVWLARSEPWSRLEQPGSIPPSGSESFPALVSGCRCGCGLRRAKSAGLVCLWCPAAGAGTVEEPRPEHLAPWVWTKTHASVVSMETERSGPDFLERLTSHLWWESGDSPVDHVCQHQQHLMSSLLISWDAELSIWKGISQGLTKTTPFLMIGKACALVYWKVWKSTGK